ncbi:FeoB-associated Cys-rich membrane protein [Enterococcus timonensis]|nr:FeoB-associated Cys-rich membrane protein [Enterococcus timonensis]
MSTFILGVFIFGSCGLVIYKTIKRGSSCEDCTTACAVKDLKKS